MKIAAIISTATVAVAALPMLTAVQVTSPPTVVPGCTDVSVDGDAVFCIKGPVCSGWGAVPSSTTCPKVGDVAVDECFDDMKSFDKKSGYCVAPVAASCKKVKTGAWGCVWDVPAPPAVTPGATTKAPVTTPAATTKTPVTTPAATTKAPVTTPAATTKAPVVTPVATTKTPVATPAVTTSKPSNMHTFPDDCVDVSVEGDATFCITGPVCSGTGATPTGTKCPKIGDHAVDDCYDYIPSGKSNKTEFCVAHVDATCKKIKTGAWGCVWSGPATITTKTSFAAGGAAGAAASNSVGIVAGCVAAVAAVAGTVFAVAMRRKRQQQEGATQEFVELSQSPAHRA